MVDLLASDEHDAGAVRSQDIAVLFVDIVGFTEHPRARHAQQVMDLLRRYHALIEEAIFENGGTLDKYLGDGVMATSGRRSRARTTPPTRSRPRAGSSPAWSGSTGRARRAARPR